MKLFDIWSHLQEGEAREYAQSFAVVDVTNIHKAVEEKYRRDRQSRDLVAEAPSLLPPFERLWIEYQQTRDFGIGVLFDSTRLEGSVASRHEYITKKFDFADRNSVRNPMSGQLWGRYGQRTGSEIPEWLVSVGVKLFRRPQGFGDIGISLMALDSAGIPVQDTGPGVPLWWYWPFFNLQSNDASGDDYTGVVWDDQSRKITNHFIMSIHVSMFAIGLMHCKNVELVDGTMPPPKVQDKQERKIGQPLTTFKELVIDPNRNQKRYTDEGDRQNRRRDIAAHIVRGHFATYTEDRPRFGRREDGVGTFYIQPHVRGSADVGMVGKDYKVKSPKQEAR